MIKSYPIRLLLFKFSFVVLCLGTLCDTMLFSNLNLGFFHINIETPKTAAIIYLTTFILITDFKFANIFSGFDKKTILLLTLLLFCCLLSSFFSVEKEKAFKTLFNFTTYFLCLIITIRNVQDFKEAGNFIFKTFLIFNFVLAASCILDFYIPAFNKFLMANFGHNELKHSFFKYNGEMILRPSGLTSDTNLTAFSIAIALLLIIANYSFFENKIFIWLNVLASGFAFGMLSSRSAQIIIILSAILFIAFKLTNFKTVLKITAVFFLIQLGTVQTQARIMQMFDKEALNEEATYGRTMIWRGAWLAFNENKIYGVGPGVFFNKSIDYISRTMDKNLFDTLEKTSYNPHNIFLVFLSEEGIIGGVVFLSLLIFLAYSFISKKKYLSLIFLVSVLIVSSLSNYAPYFKYYLLICIIIYALDKQNFRLNGGEVDF